MMSTLFLREHNRIADRISRAVIEDYINHITPIKFPLFAEPGIGVREKWYRQNWMSIEFNLLYRAFSQALANPLLAPGIFGADTFSRGRAENRSDQEAVGHRAPQHRRRIDHAEGQPRPQAVAIFPTAKFAAPARNRRRRVAGWPGVPGRSRPEQVPSNPSNRPGRSNTNLPRSSAVLFVTCTDGMTTLRDRRFGLRRWRQRSAKGR